MYSQGTAIYSLMRNIGSSIGISLVQTMLVRNAQVAHSSLVANLNVDPSLGAGLQGPGYDLAQQGGLALLNAEVTRQATMIAYVDDFKLMLVMTLLVIPLLALIRVKRQTGAPASSAHAAID